MQVPGGLCLTRPWKGGGTNGRPGGMERLPKPWLTANNAADTGMLWGMEQMKLNFLHCLAFSLASREMTSSRLATLACLTPNLDLRSCLNFHLFLAGLFDFLGPTWSLASREMTSSRLATLVRLTPLVALAGIASKLQSAVGRREEDELASALPRCDSITQRELDRAIGRLAGSLANGPDGIPPGLLKRTKRQTREMQALLDICAGEGTDLGLIVSARKSVAMRFTPQKEAHLSGLPDGRWAREAYKYVHIRVEAIRLMAPLQRDTRKKVRESVNAVETERWREPEWVKRALALYQEGKMDIAKEAFYDNSRGSGLLCKAQSGVLRTRLLRARYTDELDVMCPLCQDAEETIRHIVLKCTGLRPVIHDAQDSGTSGQNATGATNDNSALSRALSFRAAGEPPSWKAVEATKRRLEYWCKKQVKQTCALRRL
ncbi:hypothetical protein HPB52_001612 [Rhipicephalus sanguineus]|uniref:Tick transposon n=1 Tax=Rhipicephalus sanguineus TaxID=34632 RepID=A0A9D4PIS2_RHISA|nr:hypothetical protein HPB52_001612 [Rhipicephalus sanguineus]